MSHVFMCYVRENQKEVQTLCKELAKHGVRVWVDRDKIRPGSRWKDAIREAIRSGDFFIACFSREYRSRGRTYFNEELTLAIEELRLRPCDRTWFVPVLLSECDVPARSIGGGETLRDIQWVELYSDWPGGIERILDVIQPVPVEVQRHIEALRSDDSIIRMRAAGELGRIGDIRAVPALIDALSDEDMHVRSDAAIALGSICDVRSVPALIRALVDDEYGRVGEAAMMGLLNIGEPAIPDLRRALHHEDIRIRKAAANTLRSMAHWGKIPGDLEGLEEY